MKADVTGHELGLEEAIEFYKGIVDDVREKYGTDDLKELRKIADETEDLWAEQHAEDVEIFRELMKKAIKNLQDVIYYRDVTGQLLAELVSKKFENELEKNLKQTLEREKLPFNIMPSVSAPGLMLLSELYLGDGITKGEVKERIVSKYPNMLLGLEYPLYKQVKLGTIKIKDGKLCITPLGKRIVEEAVLNVHKVIEWMKRDSFLSVVADDEI